MSGFDDPTGLSPNGMGAALIPQSVFNALPESSHRKLTKNEN